MSVSRNTDAMDNQGEFSSKVPPSQPLTTQGHKPGVKVGNDAIPEFSAKTYPPGTAPRDDTFQPNPQAEIPGQALNTDSITRSDPLDFGGATSGTVHNDTKFGHPAQGETSSEARSQKKGNGTGIEGRIMGGNSGVETGDGSVESKVRGVGADLEGRAGDLKGQKGYSGVAEGGSNISGAEEALPISSDQVASEFP